MKVSFPVQPAPPASSPVAVNWMGPVEGVFVRPVLKVISPVGAAGVPPHVHSVLACAEAEPPPAKTRPAATSAMMPIVARNLIFIDLPLVCWCYEVFGPLVG